MRERILTLCLALLILPCAAMVASAQDASHIVVNGSRADHLDENSDGTYDIVRVIASLSTTAPSAEVGIEVIAENGDLSISFWNNTTIAAGEGYALNTTVKAWANGEFRIWLRVWDLEAGMLTHDEFLGAHELIASLTPPRLTMNLESEPVIFTGDTCLIHRVSTDLVGGHYDVMGTVSIQGVPWLVGEYETPLDCSHWPAGQYNIAEHYRNGLGMTAQAELSFTIHVHPPPAFQVNVSGRATEAGTACELSIFALQDTQLPEMGVGWAVTDPAQGTFETLDSETLDCTMWAPGVHKVRATLTSPQGLQTTIALNLIRLPPADDASLEVLNASGDPERWPAVSEGDDFEPAPLFLNLGASIVAVGLIGTVLAVLAGLAMAARLSRAPATEAEMWEAPIAPDSEGMPTHVDDAGIHWRQHPDGSVDWWDAGTNQWMRFQG